MHMFPAIFANNCFNLCFFSPFSPYSFNCGQTFTQRFSMRRHTLRECPNSTTRDEIREAEKLSGKANERLQKNRQKAQEYMERASKFIKMSSTF